MNSTPKYWNSTRRNSQPLPIPQNFCLAVGWGQMLGKQSQLNIAKDKMPPHLQQGTSWVSIYVHTADIIPWPEMQILAVP